jgi:hypothetical protein
LPDLTHFLSFDWLEGSRTFSIAFGTLTAGACLLLAVPILFWCLPGSRAWIFGRDGDRQQLLQIAYGVLCMSMAFADALCRYIPHRKLGVVHPAFFLTTVALVVILAPRIYPLARHAARRSIAPPARAALGVACAALVVFPITAVVRAFWL